MGGDRYELRLNKLFLPAEQAPAAGSVVTVEVYVAEEPVIELLARVLSTETSEGTTQGIRVQLLGPDPEAKTGEPKRIAAPAKRPPSGSLRVLIVDDDESYRAAAVDAVEGAGFEVLQAQNGAEGLALAIKHEPAVIISDVNMPGMDGWQLLRVLRSRARSKNTAVIFMTTLDDESERLRGYQLGVDDYVAKPFSGVELLARVERAIERAQAARLGSDLAGELAHVSLATLLSLIEMERRTAVLELTREDERATLHLRDGAIVRVDLDEAYDGLEGRQRVFRVLDWPDGQFELTTTKVTGADEIRLPSSFLLLEYARLCDESGG